MVGIYTYGETAMFTCSSKEKLRLVFMPGYEKWESDYNPTDCGLLYVDHCVEM